MTRNIETPYEIDGIEFKAIGNRIQQALELRGMRQSELSEKTGIAPFYHVQKPLRHNDFLISNRNKVQQPQKMHRRCTFIISVL